MNHTAYCDSKNSLRYIMFHISDTVVSGLLGHDTHAVLEADRGELAHFGPLVLIRIII